MYKKIIRFYSKKSAIAQNEVIDSFHYSPYKRNKLKESEYTDWHRSFKVLQTGNFATNNGLHEYSVLVIIYLFKQSKSKVKIVFTLSTFQTNWCLVYENN